MKTAKIMAPFKIFPNDKGCSEVKSPKVSSKLPRLATITSTCKCLLKMLKDFFNNNGDMYLLFFLRRSRHSSLSFQDLSCSFRLFVKQRLFFEWAKWKNECLSGNEPNFSWPLEKMRAGFFEAHQRRCACPSHQHKTLQMQQEQIKIKQGPRNYTC